MSNIFNKEERIAFENLLEGFQDALVISNAVNINRIDQTLAERSNNTIWRPQPYIATSYPGFDQTQNFDIYTQLSIPASINTNRSVPWTMTPLELRDSLQEGRLVDRAKQKLASDINVAVTNVICDLGSIFVKRSNAASGFDDVAEIDSVLNEQGVDMENRYLGLSSRSYNAMASNLQTSSRSFNNPKSVNAYEKAYVGNVAGFETLKMDYAPVKTVAAGGAGITMSTLAAANNFYVPRATSTAASGEQSNVDNRFQTITVSSTTNVAIGDAFTIAGVTACHHITKLSTGQPKTFRVRQIVDGTTLRITAPIVSGQGGSDAETQYQNCIVSPSASAAITFLNTATGAMNPFWLKDAIEILPGRLALGSESGSIMRATTDNGLEVLMSKQWDNKSLTYTIRVDCFFGVVNLQPQMSGIIMFSQP